MMESADRHRVLVADLAVERARLREANVMCFGGCAAAYHAGLRGDELTVLLIAQTNGLRGNPTAPDGCRFRSRRLGTGEGPALFARSFVARIVDTLPRRSAWRCSLDRGEPLPKADLDRFSVGGDQRVLGGQVLVGPVGGLVTGLELTEICEQLFAQRR